MADVRLEFERQLFARGLRRVAGVDEAGRGPLAGPVVACAVILPESWIIEGLPKELSGLNDSKQLTPRRRDQFCDHLRGHPGVSIGLAVVEPEVIDRINILRATHQAMVQALDSLLDPPQHVLVDGLPVKSIRHPQTALVKGDARSYSIAAASVVAKVTRDLAMLELDRQYPVYGFAGHKGYGTPMHLAALLRHGPTPAHRRTFAPVRDSAAQGTLPFEDCP